MSKAYNENERNCETSEEIELPNQEIKRTLGETENCKYLEILGVNIIKQIEMKEKF